MKIERIINKPFCIAMFLCGFIYGLALPFFCGNNPMSPLGTLSLLCEDRKIWFWLWGILVSGGIVINAQYMYRKYGQKNKLLDVLCGLSFVSMCCIALALLQILLFVVNFTSAVPVEKEKETISV